MSYHIYTTKGLVISARPVREADRIYSILTRDFGLLRAIAGGVRNSTSKLRGSLEPLSLANISLVKGKERWRITSVEQVRKIRSLPEITRPLVLLEKLVQGEEAHPELFDVVESALEGDPIFGEGDEIVLVARILHALGYLEESDLQLGKTALVKAINQGLKESGLA